MSRLFTALAVGAHRSQKAGTPLKEIEDKLIPTSRLLEIDFFRGAAILIIFWNHLLYLVQQSGFLVHSPFRIHYGFSDSATVFVFLSGFVSGNVYDRYIRKNGFFQTQKKALRRSGQIYVAQLATLVVLFVFALLWPDDSPLYPLCRRVRDFSARPFSGGIGLMTLQSCLDFVDILPFYITILPAVPLLITGFRKRPSLPLLASLIVYLAVQVLDLLNHDIWMPDWFVNPLAWQFLFVLGLFAGFRWQNKSLAIRRSTTLTILATMGILSSFLAFPVIQTALRHGIPFLESRLPDSLSLPFTGKSLLQPFVLVHFACVGYLAWLIVQRHKHFLFSRLARPLVVAGQHSLPVYCLATVLDYIFAHLIVHAGGNSWGFVSAGVLGCFLITGTPMLLWNHLPLHSPSPDTRSASPLTGTPGSRP